MMKENDPQRLTLEDVRSALGALKEDRESTMGFIDVLYELARNKQELAQKISGNAELMEKFGNKEEILKELDVLEQTYEDELLTIEAAKRFGDKVEKQSWGKWALEKVKSVVKFPVRHPIIFLLILLVVLGALAGYMGYLPGLGGTLAGWGQKAKALLGFETAAESAGALEAAREAANVPNIILNTVENNVFYDGTKYGIDELPALLEKLPVLKENQCIDILKDATSRTSIESPLESVLNEKFGKDFVRILDNF